MHDKYACALCGDPKIYKQKTIKFVKLYKIVKIVINW